MRPLVIFHGGCRDGFCAAWVYRQAFAADDPEFHGGYYGQDPPDVTGRDVVIVDFGYPLKKMQEIAKKANSLLVLDHHKTAQEALASLSGDNVKVVFDMNRSGARLAWDEYFRGKPRPWLVDYVEDRDLWRNALKDSLAVNAYISLMPFEFEVWDEERATGSAEQAKGGGMFVLGKMAQYVREVSKHARLVWFEGMVIPVVNAPQVDVSELLEFLCKDRPFAVGWFQRKDGLYQYSLRSRGGFDVSEVAKKYGGGGHQAAAGFQSDRLIYMSPFEETTSN